MRILVCGGRNLTDRAAVFAALDKLHFPLGLISAVIHGAAGRKDRETKQIIGADLLAADWATSRGIPVEPFPADWDQHGRAAGPIRNRQMLREGRPDAIVAFAGVVGTADMCQAARRAGVRVIRV